MSKTATVGRGDPAGRPYQLIKKVKKSRNITDYFTEDQLQRINKALKEVICENIDQLKGSVSFTDEELRRLKEVKTRRIKECHYNRFD